MNVEILSIDREQRMITVRFMPKSQRELIEAICAYWQKKELPFSIGEVLRFEKPQRIFYSTVWTEGEKE